MPSRRFTSLDSGAPAFAVARSFGMTLASFFETSGIVISSTALVGFSFLSDEDLEDSASSTSPTEVFLLILSVNISKSPE